MIALTNRAFSTQNLIYGTIFTLALVLLILSTGSSTTTTTNYFPNKSSLHQTPLFADSTDSTNKTNPLLTTEGINALVLENAFPRASDRADFVALRTQCRRTPWRKNVYISCIHNAGDIVVARNSVLNCIHFALSAGATGLMLPQVEVMSVTSSSAFKTRKYKEMGHFFDVSWFRNVMLANCGNMMILDRIENVPSYEYATFPELVSLQKIMGGGAETRNTNGENFHHKFDEYIAGLSTQPSGKTPVIVRLDEQNAYGFKPSADEPHIANNFGYLAEFRQDLIALSNLVVDRLKQSLQNAANSTSEITGASEFIGVYFGPEITSSAEQKSALLEKFARATMELASRYRIKLVYVGTSDDDALKHIRNRAAEVGALVIDKRRMLTGNEKEYFDTLDLDQQSIVDYLVLLKANRFLGSRQSPFSNQLILKRRVLTNETLDESGHGRDDMIGETEFREQDMLWQ
ncbi:hypothetical protein H072_901 [Dactylellina haptotyla CBS 200.50]|uniref:Uncharacterized protein n=1 Tax=Dactylellina haptotyla (strain CBS 200.50) TaxID=1284197 RepID=S8C070_DACHA|nr:hypothetical protein H072_901 [Dactylellina haptotyla CBS 200.50]